MLLEVGSVLKETVIATERSGIDNERRCWTVYAGAMLETV